MNKTIITRGLWGCLCFLTLYSFFSCEKEKESEEIRTIPTVKLFYSTNANYETFVKNGDVLEYTLKLNSAESSEGVKIDKVVYYWDGNQVMTALDSDHKFSILTDQMLGLHVLRSEIFCSGDGYTSISFNLSHEFTVVDDYPIINFVADYPETVSNGDTFTCSIKKYEGNTMNVSITKVTYYWDSDKLIETSMAPYTLSYPLSNVTAGEHILRVAVSVTGDWSGTITYPYKVTVN